MRRDYIEMNNRIEEFYYTAQEMFTKLNILPGDYFNQDFFEFNETMVARKPEDREVADPIAYLRKMRKEV